MKRKKDSNYSMFIADFYDGLLLPKPLSPAHGRATGAGLTRPTRTVLFRVTLTQ